MSKFVKGLQIDFLKRQFADVKDLLIVNPIGLDAVVSNELRLDLRRKGIYLQVVKNSLARRVLADLGVEGVDSYLDGRSAIAWGGPGIVELAKEIAEWAKKVGKFEIKGGCVDGKAIDSATVEELSQLPSREELLGRIVMLANAPAARVLNLATAPAGTILGQIKSIAEPESDASD